MQLWQKPLFASNALVDGYLGDDDWRLVTHNGVEERHLVYNDFIGMTFSSGLGSALLLIPVLMSLLVSPAFNTSFDVIFGESPM